MLNLLFSSFVWDSPVPSSTRGASKFPRQCCGRAATRGMTYEAQVLHIKLGAQPEDQLLIFIAFWCCPSYLSWCK